MLVGSQINRSRCLASASYYRMTFTVKWYHITGLVEWYRIIALPVTFSPTPADVCL